MKYPQLRSNKSPRRIPYAAAALLALAAGTARAGYNLTTLASFTSGSGPSCVPIVSGNTLYGTTSGTVFSVPVTGGTPTVMAALNSSTGYYPSGGLILSGNILYGTASSGGAHSDGTVFSVPVTGGTPTVLASFNGSNGQNPEGVLVVSGNTLYGTTAWGGAYGHGTVFSLPVSGGTPTVLASFDGYASAGPEAGLILSGNTLYGTTWGGPPGPTGYGTVFSVPVSGGTPTFLANFSFGNLDAGVNPYGPLLLSGNTLYGTTSSGGGYGVPSVFSVPITGGTPTILAAITGSDGGLILSGNTLYGTTKVGGAHNAGTVFSVPLAGGRATTVASFDYYNNGEWPEAGVVLSGNTLYGTTSTAGPGGGGTVFAVDLTKPSPIVSLTATAPTAFGSKVGTLTLVGGKANSNTASFTATPTDYLAVSGFNPLTSTEFYALHITDSAPGNLAADLADAVSEINGGSYSGYSLTASTADPIGYFGSGYNFFLTFTGSTLGTGSPYFGFDFTQLNGTSDTLSVNAVAVVPEPASVGLLALGAGGLLARRRHRGG